MADLTSPELELGPANLVKQGAEARIYTLPAKSFARRGRVLVKERFCKKYRHEVIDRRLRKAQTHTEVKSLLKCRRLGIDTPVIYSVDNEKFRIFMEYVDGQTLKATLNALNYVDDPQDRVAAMCFATQLGRCLATLHGGNVVHGDLTTSNVLVRSATLSTEQQVEDQPAAKRAKTEALVDAEDPAHEVVAVAAVVGKDPVHEAAVAAAANKAPALVMIDFGLSYQSRMIEDKAVDLYVLEKAFTSTHPNSEDIFKAIITAYQQAHSGNSKVLQKLHNVRQRGRKRSMAG